MAIKNATMTGTAVVTASFSRRVVRGMAAAVIGVSIATAATTNKSVSSSAVYGSAVASVNAGLTKKFSASVIATSDASASITVIRNGLTVCDVLRDILMSWGMESPCSAPQMAKIAALNVINQSMQVVWNQAIDRSYWTTSNLSVAITSGSTTSVLANDIQNVTGPVRLTTGELLVPLANVSELENFSASFLDGDSASVPVAYYLDREKQSGADPVKCILNIVPAPSGNITVKMEVVTEAPRYSLLDFDSCPLCPIPHKYVESLLMPVCRHMAMSSHLFIARDRQEAIVNGYAQARLLLDVADPLAGQSGDNIGYRKGAKAK